ncbi:MAG: hypothetical protein F4041_02570 [Acidobacteriia bacterium]|nr:hypothetical protein [Terriglobia bacterium]
MNSHQKAGRSKHLISVKPQPIARTSAFSIARLREFKRNPHVFEFRGADAEGNGMGIVVALRSVIRLGAITASLVLATLRTGLSLPHAVAQSRAPNGVDHYISLS